MEIKVKETLEKQLQLLSERSEDKGLDANELEEISNAMAVISRLLLDL